MKEPACFALCFQEINNTELTKKSCLREEAYCVETGSRVHLVTESMGELRKHICKRRLNQLCKSYLTKRKNGLNKKYTNYFFFVCFQHVQDTIQWAAMMYNLVN